MNKQYVLCWRDIVEHNILYEWEPVPTKGVYNGDFIDVPFTSEKEIFNWLTNRKRTQNTGKTIGQIKMNADPDKLYAIYSFEYEHDYNNPSNDLSYMYTVRLSRPNENPSKIIDVNGKVIKSPFVKIHKNIYNLKDRLRYSVPNIPGKDNPINSQINISKSTIDHSPNMRIINGVYYEGVFPLSYELGLDDEINNEVNDDINENTNINIDKNLLYDYMDYVMATHETDQTINDSNIESYDLAFLGSTDKWLDNFYNKLVSIEKYLIFLKNGGQGYFNLDGRTSDNRNILRNSSPLNAERNDLINRILNIITMNQGIHVKSENDTNKIMNLVKNPKLKDGNLFEVRYRNSLMIWHEAYSEIIRELRLVPSRDFSEFVVNFNINTFFEQYQTVERLQKIYLILAKEYGISNSNTRRNDNSRTININNNITVRNSGNIIRIKRKF